LEFLRPIDLTIDVRYPTVDGFEVVACEYITSAKEYIKGKVVVNNIDHSLCHRDLFELFNLCGEVYEAHI
jgi:hypothetical protein